MKDIEEIKAGIKHAFGDSPVWRRQVSGIGVTRDRSKDLPGSVYIDTLVDLREKMMYFYPAGLVSCMSEILLGLLEDENKEGLETVLRLLGPLPEIPIDKINRQENSKVKGLLQGRKDAVDHHNASHESNFSFYSPEQAETICDWLFYIKDYTEERDIEDWQRAYDYWRTPRPPKQKHSK